MSDKKKKVGRPVGTRLSAASRAKISASMRKNHRKHDKISDEERIEILDLYDARELPIATIAEMYNITEKHLFSLIKMLRGGV